MRSKPTVLVLSTFVGATLVASVLAQQNPGGRPAAGTLTVTAPDGGQQPAQASRSANGLSTYSPADAQPSIASVYVSGTDFFNPVLDPANAELANREAMLSQKADSLSQQLRDAESGDRKAIQEQLAEVLGQQFDLRQERHQKEIVALEEQVERLKDLVDRRQGKRSEILTRRLDQIVLDAEGLGW